MTFPDHRGQNYPGGDCSPEAALRQRLPLLRLRNRVLDRVRQFFTEQGFEAVETPALQISPGLETHLHAFATRCRDPWGGPEQTFYLHTSPEFAMKKLVAAGMERIFQIARVFRNGEISPRHSPEFTMVEWYAVGQTLDDLIAGTTALVRESCSVAGVTTLRHGEHAADPFAPWPCYRLPDLIAQLCGIDLLATTTNPLQPDREALAAQMRQRGLTVSDTDQWDDLVFRLMLDHMDPYLEMLGTPAVVRDWPVFLAPLARPSTRDSRVAERFEVYACGLELCNGFDELTDPVLQRQRFAMEMSAKQTLYGETYPIDEEFLTALSFMPATAGNALGLDRLLMLLTGAPSIADVLWQRVSCPERSPSP